MADAEAIWADKADDELLEAAGELSEYTEEGERIILAELERRGLPQGWESRQALSGSWEIGWTPTSPVRRRLA
jgi:hypothetical protein